MTAPFSSVGTPMRRTWVKFWVSECLEGSIRYQLDSAERGVWYDLILFSALGSHPGIICDNDRRPFPNDFIASRLNISLELLERTISKCKEEGRLVVVEGVLYIEHWEKYQSEYQRQKIYREKKEETTPEGLERRRGP